MSLDISLSKTGWAVLSVSDDGTLSIVDYGLIRSNAKKTDGERLREIHAGVLDVLSHYDVEKTISREAGIIRFNTASKQIYKATGVIEFALDGYTIVDVNIQTVKAWGRRLTGLKGNDKSIVTDAVRAYFNDPTIPGDDICDAIAVGVVFLASSSRQ